MKMLNFICVLTWCLHITCANLSGSLWGQKVVLQHINCQFWKLNYSVPDLSEFTVCMKIQRSINSSTWSAFSYCHSNRSHVELGFGGHALQLQVTLFGKNWVTPNKLTLADWHSICITWACSASQLQLFINGTLMNLELDPEDTGAPARNGEACKLEGGGSLLLGASHYFLGEDMMVDSGKNLQGSVTLFRMWSQARDWTQINNNCTDGDLIAWHHQVWEMKSQCPAVPDDTLTCAWTLYKIKIRLLICGINTNVTTTYDAEHVARCWLEHELPYNILRIMASTVQSRFNEPEMKKTHECHAVRVDSVGNWFNILVYLTVIPSREVIEVQKNVTNVLKSEHHFLPDYHLIIEKNSLQVYPTDSDSGTELPPTPDSSVTVIHTSSTSQCEPPCITDTYFRVSMNVSLSKSDQDPEDIIQTWLSKLFCQKGIYVLNFLLISEELLSYILTERSTGLRKEPFITSTSRCEFQILVPVCFNVIEKQEQIQNLLQINYSTGTVELHAPREDIHISVIRPCPRHTQQTRKGLYVWEETEADKFSIKPCVGDSTHTALRKCFLGAMTDSGVWEKPNLQFCPMVVKTLADLENIKVTNDTAMDILDMIRDMMMESEMLKDEDLHLVLNTLETVLNVSTVTFDLAQAIINITSEILTSKSDLHPLTNNILNITAMVGDKMFNFSGDSVSIVAQALVLSVVDVNLENFYNLTFGVTTMTDDPHPKVFINQDPGKDTVAFISLPLEIHISFPQHYTSKARVQFQFYRVPELFQDNQSNPEHVLNTFVIYASVINAVRPINDLKTPINITLHHLNTNLTNKDVQCVFWNFNKNRGNGGWSSSGCWKYTVTHEYTTCMCDHLTHFGVLLDISRTPIDAKNEKILTLITYIGCGVSSFFLGVTVLTHTLLEKLRRDYPSQILLNLSIALLSLNLVFLVNSWFSSFNLRVLCIAVAFTQHYFLLASFTWMFLEAVNMYLALVKVFNIYVPSYILKFCFIGWGVPLVICSLVLLVNSDSYGLQPLQNSEKFCWVSDDVVFYVCVVTIVGLILLVNSSIFLVVLVQVRKACVSEHRGIIRELRGVASLTLLLGLTWSTAFFAWGGAKIPLLYLFSILNSLQGFFIFIFQCLMKENVRKQWRVHLCFGRLKLQEQSEWSHTAPIGTKINHKPGFQFLTVASVRSDKSSSTRSSSASSDSTQQLSLKRPDLGVVYQQSLILPRAQGEHGTVPESSQIYYHQP